MTARMITKHLWLRLNLQKRLKNLFTFLKVNLIFHDRFFLYVPDGIKITGAGQWHTKLHFLNTEAAKYDDKGYASGGGGITFEPDSKDIDLGNLSMDSNLNSRHDEKANYKGISGTLGTGSSIHDIKIEHF